MASVSPPRYVGSITDADANMIGDNQKGLTFTYMSNEKDRQLSILYNVC